MPGVIGHGTDRRSFQDDRYSRQMFTGRLIHDMPKNIGIRRARHFFIIFIGVCHYCRNGIAKA